MKLLILTLFLPQFVMAAVITTTPLDEGTPLLVEVGIATTTVLQFPSPIEAIIGADLTTTEAQGKFQLHHLETSNLITLKSLDENAQSSMTVVMGGKLYLFFLRASRNPTSVLRLTAGGSSAADSITRQEILDLRPVNHERKFRYLINLARNPDLLSQKLPELYRGARKRTDRLVCKRYGLTTVIQEITQFPEEDALVFIGTLEGAAYEDLQEYSYRVLINKTPLPIGHLHLIPPSATESLVHFAAVILGNGQGRAAHFSLENEFQLSPFLQATPIKHPR